ncbi:MULTISPECIES: abscisic acid-deficient protein Aba4 family protein [unclassified Lentimonas]|uniref:abscisic acid-deficient protein Aba4 family protein n=1 Tax=unclassified Lentimonas TaxID=2630993 RepID=UPI0013280C17|nr:MULTISPECIES: abscisic acid-deficient protein Aba4 family protein [unclassified Lentimonas]CAA6677851.1 Unannotated [Lentimonas sp. CC4]CAA6683955.1 Unannotated [Lentimonas sp. CC6]CAA6689946.1 Unannotated [Lentimonas sp. CC10]CAA6691016.1 Unannotated [Lentimonas sp. CC19]CAA7069363.1 Unannotated [Lentimonas sp. CC11]
MPIWLIDVLGARNLNSAFLILALMTLPIWIGMVCLPNSRLVRQFAQPLIVAPIYCTVLFVLLWRCYQASVLPDPMKEISYSAAQGFARHPVAFLTFYCNFQIMNLALGTMMYQKTLRAGFRAPVELVLCWLLGALAFVPFVIRLLIRRQSIR